ncbi:hypothetical protein [Ruegeria sp. HKCCD8929]|uniref:hypothetical protein n=1 Tax=Ruegeria sp. HKCCD8929 TaxID=2683006 RepID=UPI001488F237|nr:hypothetical protein [Ruegeria sp. HKCCD8929]
MEAGRETATGNISLANASMNNMAANKYNTSSLYDTGVATRRLSNGAFKNTNPDGSVSYSTGTAQTTGGLVARLGETIRSEVSESKDAAIRTATSARDEWTSALNQTASNYTDFGRQLASGSSTARDSSTSSGRGARDEARQSHQAIEDFAKQHGISVDAAYRLGIGMKALGNGLTADATGLDKDSFERASKAAREVGLAETVSKYSDAVESIRASETSSLSNSQNTGDRWSIDETSRIGATYAKAREEAETLSARESELASRGTSYDSQLINAIVNEWREDGFSDEQISGFLNPHTASDYKRQEQAIERVLPDLMDGLGFRKPSPDLTSAFALNQPRPEVMAVPLPSDGKDHLAEVDRVQGATSKVQGALDDRYDARSARATGKASTTERIVIDGQDLGVVPGLVVKGGTTIGDVVDSGVDMFRPSSGGGMYHGMRMLSIVNGGGVMPSSASQSPQQTQIRMGIVETAASLGVDPVDLATAISYETAGTFSPTIAGPTTQHGQHAGLIQFGETQAARYGVDWNNPVGSQLGANGAVANYLRDAGVRPGMGLLDIYSAINAGSVGRYNASDENNGGAPGTVADKVNNQMAGHRENAIAFLGGTVPVRMPSSVYSPGGGSGLTGFQMASADRGMFDTVSPLAFSPMQGFGQFGYGGGGNRDWVKEMLASQARPAPRPHKPLTDPEFQQHLANLQERLATSPGEASRIEPVNPHGREK